MWRRAMRQPEVLGEVLSHLGGDEILSWHDDASWKMGRQNLARQSPRKARIYTHQNRKNLPWGVETLERVWNFSYRLVTPNGFDLFRLNLMFCHPTYSSAPD